jgi:oxygen-independent coproporphyrinogen-3 oxidase
LPRIFKSEIEELKDLEEAGLLEWQGTNMQVPIKGRLLARRVAMTFDRYLRESQAKGTYSKVL